MQHIFIKTKQRVFMANAKIENLLNLALDASVNEREKSFQLGVGYSPAEQTWEVIVRFIRNGLERVGDLLTAYGYEDWHPFVTRLDNSYAILILPEAIVDLVAGLDEIIYMEKPKRLFFAVNSAKRASCITSLQSVAAGTAGNAAQGGGLSGKGCLVAVIDSGIDYSHPDFCNADHTTRIAALWDQTLDAAALNDARTEDNMQVVYRPPETYADGVLFTREELNLALAQNDAAIRQKIVPSRDTSGHGTHVAGIAAGNGRASMGRYRGVAYEAELLVVKLGTPGENSFPKTTELMKAVDFCIRAAEHINKPLAINLSFGNNYGSHSGTSLIETFLNDMAGHHQCSIVAGTGNEGASTAHYQGRINSREVQTVELAVSMYERKLNLQIWKRYQDELRVEVLLPDGKTSGQLIGQGTLRVQFESVELLIFYGEPSPYSIYQEIYIDFIPRGQYIPAGLWNIRLTAGRIVDGVYDMWLPSGGVLNTETGFPYPSEIRTLTIPSTAQKVISVAAYDSNTDSAAAFSGRGYTAWTNQVKPDLAAPGVDIISASPGGGYTSRSGTSMAAPFVTGSAALMMEWGERVILLSARFLHLWFFCLDEITDIWALPGKHFIIEILFPINVCDAVLQFFYGITQRFLLSGQHFFPWHNGGFSLQA